MRDKRELGELTFSKEWIDILNRVQQIIRRNIQTTTWYRGMSNAGFKLNAGIFRGDLPDISTVTDYESNYYHIFKSMGHMEHNKNDWDLLYVMQHHGVKTRLLDWSESFTVALFFAYSTWDQKSDAVVWALNPTKLNLASYGTENLKVFGEKDDSYLDFIMNEANQLTTAIYPLKNSKRMVAQQGVFTLQGNAMLSLEEEQDGKLLSEKILEKIVIPKELASDVKTYLALSGSNYYTLFPDLDGLAKHLNNLFPIELEKIEYEILVPDLPDNGEKVS